MRFIDPLEQFNPILISLSKTTYSCFNTNMLFVCSFIICSIIFFFLFIRNIKLISWLSLFYVYFINFIKNVVRTTLPMKKQIFLPFLSFNFLFVLMCNIIGMIPGSFTVTSHISVTFFLSLAFFFAMNIIGTVIHGIFFVNIFLPDGIPLLLTPLLFFLEVTSYFSRVFSLSIRLFANMMSGHSLMKILAGFCWSFISSYHILIILVFFIPFTLIVGIIGLEILIAYLQAYVFLSLTSIYLGNVIFLH